ncbi:MAG: SurA N-terminal domain-containing protein [Muribaculaceae bacterium]|nr:SurA N-terminal domain-containing protein [Muribaculaceae bacterium]
MATLEKIRKRSVLLLIVIAVALLAFILGDAITNGRNLFGNGTTVAKIGGEKIDVQEFQRRREELSQQLEEARKNNPEQVANFDAQTLSQLALDQLINERLYDEAVKKTGIRTSADVLRFYMLESPNMMPELQNIVRSLAQQNLSVANAQQAYDVIFNPKRYNLTESQVAPYQRQWIAVENKYKQQIGKLVYQNLLSRTFKANDLDKKALFNDFVETTSVDFAYVPYGQVDEKKYPVSDADLKKAYNEEKNNFKVDEPTKDVTFLSVNISPSDADKAEASRLAVAAVSSLKKGQLSKELKKEGLSPLHRELRSSDIAEGKMKSFLASAPTDSVDLVESTIQGFKIVKMGRRYAALDSIEVRMVQVAGANLPEKVLARLNGGLSADSIASAFSADSVMAAPAQWLELFTAEGKTQLGIPQSMVDSLINASGRYIILNQSEQGASLASVIGKKSPKEIYEFDEVDYAIHPSAKTLDDAKEKLEKFLAANNTAAKFKANAEKAGYNVVDVDLTQSSPAVPRFRGYNMYFPDSRPAVRWALIDGKKGEVSRIFESKDASAPVLYALAINDEYSDYVPLTNKELKDYLTNKVRNSKAGDAMVAEYSKKGNLAGAARAMGVEPRQVSDLRFGGGQQISDPAVLGQVVGSKPSAKMVVVKGDDGVYAYVIKGKGKDKYDYNADTYNQQFLQLVNPNMDQMMRGSKKLENNTYKFEADR